MVKEQLTEKQTEILQMLKGFINNNGFSPTIREICEITGRRSTATIKNYLDVLCKKGYIANKKKCPRTIKILD